MQRFYAPFVTGPGAFGLLVLRLVTGGALMLHGYPKIQHPMHWMDKMPGHPPGFLQAAAALSEFGGGLALIVGLLTPLACLGILCTMAVALLKVHLPHHDPWVGTGGKPSLEPALGYLAVAFALLLVGPGALSLDALIFGGTRQARRDRLPR